MEFGRKYGLLQNDKGKMLESMVETPLFFSNGDYELFGVLHDPGPALKKIGFIFLHPFAEEKLWAHLVFANFARELARHGYPVLRFDCMGHGDSEGEFEDSNIETRLSDIAAAQQFLRDKCTSIDTFGLLGLRFGGTLAALAAESLHDIRTLVLWDPVVDGKKYMQGLLRVNLATQNAVYKKIIHTREQLVCMIQNGDVVDVDGYGITQKLYEQLVAINLLKKPEIQYSGDSLIVQINRSGKKINSSFEKLSTRYEGSELCVVNEQPFWKEIKSFYSRADNLFSATLNWLGH